MAATPDMTAFQDRALEYFRTLLRFDTTNPPGNETPAAEYCAEILRAAGIEPRVIESAPGRGSCVARLRGSGAKAPLLLAGHLDVVPVEAEHWRHPAFDAVIVDGDLWGRGAIDMKNMVAMSLAVMVRLKEEGVPLERDLIFAAVADEEAGCHMGSHHLVDHHADLVRAEYMLGEVGGFTLYVNGLTLVPIQVAEKGLCWLRMTARGDPGHGSMPHGDQAIVKLAEAIVRIGTKRLPQHNTPVVENFIRTMASLQPFPASLFVQALLNPALSGFILDRVIPDPSLANSFRAALSNTVSPTVLSGGTKTNVIPSSASVELDGRTLPGQTSDSLISELKELIGAGYEFEVMNAAPPTVTEADTELFRHLAATVRAVDPQAIPVPYMIPGFTDAKAFSRLGTKCYGFAPIKLRPDGVPFNKLYHRHNEHIPVEGFRWGCDVLYRAVSEFVRRKPT